MKRKIFMIIVMIIFCLFVNGWFSLKPSASHEFFMEEAIPIREDDQIVGMDYYITLPRDYLSDGILKTRLLDSIYHYKDVSDVSSFLIRIHFKNLTMKDYSLKDFYVLYDQDKISYKRSNLTISSNHSSLFSFFIDFRKFDVQDSFFMIEIQ